MGNQPTTAADFEDLIEEHLPRVLDRLLTASGAGNEAQLISISEPSIRSFVEATGATSESISAERRVIIRDTENPKRSARIDRLFNTVVVEFEPPKCLRPVNEAPANAHAIDQVKEQIDGLVSHEGWLEDRVSGVVCDGARFIFCRRSSGSWIVEAPVPVDEKSTGRFLRLLASVRRPPMLPEVIARRFGIDQEDVAIGTIREFFEALKVPNTPRSGVLLSQWQEFYADVAGLDVQKLASDKDLQSFAQKITKKRALSADDLARVLFATYTYGAMLMKLLAVSAVTPFLTDKVSNPLTPLVHMDDEELVRSLRDIETGKWFQELGIQNLCEGDFFSWFVDEWTPGVARQVKKVLDVLDEYDPTLIEQTPERVRDLMKRIYHSLLPRRVRKTLGEYYTPDWLAERTLTLVEGRLWDPMERVGEATKLKIYTEEIVPMLRNSRWLDPTCGSGTFLVMLLGRLKLHWSIARQMTRPQSDELIDCPSRGDFVRALLKNVNGFDLNPLAVIASRVNFLLAIVDLLDADELRQSPIEIPVYLADSIALPQTGGGDLFADGNFMLPMRGIGRTFPVPVGLATGERMPKLAALLERDVRAGVSVDAFLTSCRQEFAIRPHERLEAEGALRELFGTLDALHRAGQNGLWAAVAKNMFMPLFLAQVDYVIGNPPWVNWEGLPEAYRQASKGLWQEMGLFVHSGMDVMLGKGKKDISTLSAYVSAHRYLKARGKLAFVITQSVFKTTGAAQGFRRFRIGDGDQLAVQLVEDFTDFQPFEDATNRTAVLVWQKGRETTYPMKNYRVWKKIGRNSPDFWATWREAVPRLTSRTLWAEPVDADDPTSSWLTASKEALEGIRKVLGRSEYRAYAGAYSGGCNPVFWLQVLRRNVDGTVDVLMLTEGAKKEVPGPHRHTIEPDLLYPLLRGRDVKKWDAKPEKDCYFLMMQDPEKRVGWPEAEVRRKYPRLYAYLKGYQKQLVARAAYERYFDPRDPIWSMFNTGEYTFAPYKVVWAWISTDFHCAVVGPEQVIPEHNVFFVPFEQEDHAHFACALLNASISHAAIAARFAGGGGGMAHTGVTGQLRLPSFSNGSPVHVALANLSREAHQVVSGGGGRPLADIERDIDDFAAKIWEITPSEIHAIQQELKVMRS